jgi:hypothetical protein
MRATPVAPRLVSWLVLVFGVLEIPWIITLLFTQSPTVPADHLRLASLGLGGGAVVLCSAAAWTIWRRRPSAAAFSVAAVTLTMFLAISLTLSPSMQADASRSVAPLLIAIPGALAGIVAAAAFLRGTAERRQIALTVAAIVLAIVALSFAFHTAAHLSDPVTTGLMSRSRAIVVLLDTGEAVGLIGAGWYSLRGKPREALVFSVLAATLLTCDAFANVVGAQQGTAFDQAIFYLLVGEIPSIILALWVARCASRKWLGDDGSVGDVPPPRTSAGLPNKEGADHGQ